MNRPPCVSAPAGIANQRPIDLPVNIGPVQLGQLGDWVTVRCPRDLNPLMRGAGGQWDPAAHRWLIAHRRIGPVIRALERTTDPLFRWAGIRLSG